MGRLWCQERLRIGLKPGGSGKSMQHMTRYMLVQIPTESQVRTLNSLGRQCLSTTCLSLGGLKILETRREARDYVSSQGTGFDNR